jgi:hypothetical protein
VNVRSDRDWALVKVAEVKHVGRLACNRFSTHMCSYFTLLQLTFSPSPEGQGTCSLT